MENSWVWPKFWSCWHTEGPNTQRPRYDSCKIKGDVNSDLSPQLHSLEANTPLNRFILMNSTEEKCYCNSYYIKIIFFSYSEMYVFTDLAAAGITRLHQHHGRWTQLGIRKKAFLSSLLKKNMTGVLHQISVTWGNFALYNTYIKTGPEALGVW